MDEQVCCPPFDPKPWQRKFVSFDHQTFVKVKVRTFSYMPLNFGSVMTKAQSQIEAAGAKVVDNIALSNHLSRWTMEVLIAVDTEVSQSATRLREVGIASNRGSACHGEYVPGSCTHRPSHHGSGSRQK